METVDQPKRLWARIKQMKGNGWLAVLVCVGFILILWGGKIADSTKTGIQSEDNSETIRYYTEELESRIAALCRQVHGITEVHVLLTLDGASEYVYAENGSPAAKEYVIIEQSEGGTPVLIQEIYPKIRGVAVVCSHGEDSEIQRTITELLSAALGIGASRIRVAGT